VVACVDAAAAERLQEACLTAYFRPYTNTDVVGTELGGSVENVIAIELLEATQALDFRAPLTYGQGNMPSQASQLSRDDRAPRSERSDARPAARFSIFSWPHRRNCSTS